MKIPGMEDFASKMADQAYTDLAFKKALIECLNDISYFLSYVAGMHEEWYPVEFNWKKLED